MTPLHRAGVLRRENIRTQRLLPWQQEEVGQFPLCEGWGGQGQSVAKGQHCLACGIYSATEPCDNLCLRGSFPLLQAERQRLPGWEAVG